MFSNLQIVKLKYSDIVVIQDLTLLLIPCNSMTTLEAVIDEFNDFNDLEFGTVIIDMERYFDDEDFRYQKYRITDGKINQDEAMRFRPSNAFKEVLGSK